MQFRYIFSLLINVSFDRQVDRMRARADDLAHLMTMENGKPLAEAKGEVREN
jgi:acyl-CoA reductase-like NAD-dependent aldehyde dehydrogenase